MRKIICALIALLCAFGLLLPATQTVSALQPSDVAHPTGAIAGPPALYIDGAPIAYKQQPYKGRTENMIPLRTAASALKFTLDWAPASKEWRLSNGIHAVVLQPNALTAVVDGKSRALSVPVTNVKGTAYVSLRFIVEASGGTIEAFVDKYVNIYWALSGHQEQLIGFIFKDEFAQMKQALHNWRELTIPTGIDGMFPYRFVKSTEMAQVFLDAGFPINYQEAHYENIILTEPQDTLLHAAAWDGNETLVSFLLDHGANADLLNAFGDKPLEEALLSRDYVKNHPEIATLDNLSLDDALANFDRTIALLRKNTRIDEVYFKNDSGYVVASTADIIPESVTISEVRFVPDGGYQISMKFKDAKKLERLTTDYLGQTLSLYLNEKLLASPSVAVTIKDGSLTITGGISEAGAKAFASLFNTSSGD